jgi:hypothetical protein
MRLVMFIGDEVIDQTNIDFDKLNTPGYVAYLQEELIGRNEEMLECCADSPRFAIENVPSGGAFASLMDVYEMQRFS